MTDYSTESSQISSWRERLERGTSSNSADKDTSNDSESHLGYGHHYSTPPPTIPEADDWAQDTNGALGSPHSQSASSIMGSPRSQAGSEHRRSIDSSSGEGHQIDRRQEKRKMKRFRLTHSQTRFLMSEFARQAHPDAAHRERLAREIPGLSPRQVQVWFQNRRAKLKRMSQDDRERMMKSRALPDEFPLLQTLQYGGRMMGTPVASPTEYSPANSANMYRDPLRRRHLSEDDTGVSPTSTSYGLQYTTSSGGEPYMGYMASPLGPQQRGNPFSRADYRAHPSVPRLQLHDTPRSLAEAAQSPLHTSTTYSSSLGHDDYNHSPAYSLQGGYHHPLTPPVSADSASGGYPYPSPNSVSSAQGGRFPPPLTLSNKYDYPPLTPHSGNFASTAPLQPPHEYSMPPQLSAPADSTTFSSSYLTRTNSMGPATGVKPEEAARLAVAAGREFGHQRKRSASHPPNFAPQQAGRTTTVE